MSETRDRSMTVDEATKPVSRKPSAADQAWQDKQTRKAIEEAKAGDFASPEALKATIRKFVPNG